MKSMLKAPGILKVEYDELPSNFGFHFKLRRYTVGSYHGGAAWLMLSATSSTSTFDSLGQ